jgi:hypothetical protein
MREEEIIKEFQKFHSCLVVPDELTTDFKQFEAYVRKEEDKWLRQTLTTYRAQVLEEVIKDINEVKNTSEGTQDWFNGISATRSVVEHHLGKHPTN